MKTAQESGKEKLPWSFEVRIGFEFCSLTRSQLTSPTFDFLGVKRNVRITLLHSVVEKVK